MTSLKTKTNLFHNAYIQDPDQHWEALRRVVSMGNRFGVKITGLKSDTFWQCELRQITFHFAEPQFPDLQRLG